IDGGTDFVEVLLVAGEEVIEHHDLARASPQQTPHNGGADEARASGNNVFAHWVSRWRNDSRAMVSAPGVKSKASSEIQTPYSRRRKTSKSGLKSYDPVPGWRPSSSFTCMWRIRS